MRTDIKSAHTAAYSPFLWHLGLFKLLHTEQNVLLCTVSVHQLTSALYKDVKQVVHLLAGCCGNLKRHLRTLRDSMLCNQKRKSCSRLEKLEVYAYVLYASLYSAHISFSSVCVSCGLFSSNLWNVVDVKTAALFDGLLIAGRLSGLRRLGNQGGGLEDEGGLRRGRLQRWQRKDQVREICEDLKS